ncbi:recombinase family protein [Glycomyces sp. A-F 0318]|uniref:recombinase family protein n=1 Tax=Glycomyces amatae TaxID=2881355 RepID=UPI001E5A926E|nr:recombinase family protein [Glycomyces amatae]MCD0446275.1 recombinase family protein [Glycomyces amatae]
MTVFARSPRRRAVLYLRVSTRAQVDTDFDPEGNSIPAQRKACQYLAERLDLTIVAEYVDPGKSGRSVDGRPAFRAMMGRIRNEGDVDVIVTYMRSRLFRDTTDAALTKQDLRDRGVAILSVKDPTDDSPTGELLAHMVDGFNEYQSRIAGQDVAYKMEAKAARGGTPGRAPLGYVNVREIVDGRQVRTIAVDKVRGPIIRALFERYATGQASYHQLRNLSIALGLRTRPTRRYPSGTFLSVNKIGHLLCDPYYVGTVTFNGTAYAGRHTPLIDQDLFDRVQRVLTEQRGGGVRNRRWHHYLKGWIWCRRSGHRITLEGAKSHSGRYHFYFLCLGRINAGDCDLPRILVEHAEAAVAAHMASFTWSPGETADVSAALANLTRSWQESTAHVQTTLKRERTRLRRLERDLLELVGHPDWPVDAINGKLTEARDRQVLLDHQLAAVAGGSADGLARVGDLLTLLEHPRQFYTSLTDDDRRTFGQLCFERLYLDVDEGHGTTGVTPVSVHGTAAAA